MAFRVFEAPDAAIAALEADDVAGRQSIVVRDGATWGVKGKVVAVSGSDEGVRHAERLVLEKGGRVCEKQDAIKADLDREADDAAGGMGFVFG